MGTDKAGNSLDGSRTRVAHKAKVAYVVLAVLAGLSYWTIRGFVAAQEPGGEEIVVSNLTLNHVIFILLIGSLSPWLTRKLFPKAPRWLFVPVALALGMLVILFFSSLGWETRW